MGSVAAYNFCFFIRLSKTLHRFCSKIFTSYEEYYKYPKFQSTRIIPTHVLPMDFPTRHFNGASQDGICGAGTKIRFRVNNILKMWM